MVFKKKEEKEEKPVKLHIRKHAEEAVEEQSVETVLEPSPPPQPTGPQKMLKIKATKQISFRGQFITLHAGEVIDPGSYGDNAEENLRQAGIEYEVVLI
jgi:hypothetical protein